MAVDSRALNLTHVNGRIAGRAGTKKRWLVEMQLDNQVRAGRVSSEEKKAFLEGYDEGAAERVKTRMGRRKRPSSSMGRKRSRGL